MVGPGAHDDVARGSLAVAHRPLLQAALVVVEVEGIDTGPRLQARTFEAPLNRALGARFDFHVGEPFQRGRRAEILSGGFRQSRLQLTAHGRQTQMV